MANKKKKLSKKSAKLGRKEPPINIMWVVQEALGEAVKQYPGKTVIGSDWNSIIPGSKWGMSKNSWLKTLEITEDILLQSSYQLNLNLTDSRKTVGEVLSRTILYISYRICKNAGCYKG